MATPELCSVDGCDKPARAGRQRHCSMHEARLRRGGSLARRVERKTIVELLAGHETGDWTVLDEGAPYQRPTDDGSRHPDGVIRTARCRCVCGVEREVAVHTLKQGQSRHCGCMVSSMIAEMKTTHGMSQTAEYRSWSHLKDRCLNTGCADFPDYGGRGITVCERWRDSFEAFYEDMGQKPSPAHSIDRIDNDGNYEPSNCRWATSIEQRNNRKRGG